MFYNLGAWFVVRRKLHVPEMPQIFHLMCFTTGVVQLDYCSRAQNSLLFTTNYTVLH